MTYSTTWDETTPAGSEARSLGDDRIRELKIQIRERMEDTGIGDWDTDPVVGPIPSGTILGSFFQAAAPTGWTQVTTHNDKMLRVVSGSGGGSGGSDSPITAHTHTGPSHSHGNNQSGALQGETLAIWGSGPYYVPYGTSLPNTAAGGTGATGSSFSPYYIDVIVCTKD